MQDPITFRPKVPGFAKRIDNAALMHGWTRTTYILRAIGKALEADEELYAATPEQIAGREARHAASIERVQALKRSRQ